VIFVDTSFWVGIAMPRDRRHEEARAVLGRWRDTHLVTSSLVRGETWTLLRRRVGHHAAVRFVDGLDATPRVRNVFLSEELEREAWTWLRRHDERSYSFVDATSFALMRSLRIREAFAFDGDFAAAGFVELRA
jgi:predicted nucleic acid-binding protein